MIELNREGDVFVLRMDSGENRFSPAFLDAFEEAVSKVEGTSGAMALVTTGTGKFYSNGLDVEWMMSNTGAIHDYLARVLGLIARLLTFRAPTVAAVNGHAFGAGALLCTAHDLRLMRNDRGFFCMPEIDMKLPLHPGMVAILQARLPKQTLHEVIVTGKRWGGTEAVARGIVDEAVAEVELLPKAMTIAGGLASKADAVMKTLKASLYPQVLEAVRTRFEG